MNKIDKEFALQCRLVTSGMQGLFLESLQEFADLVRADERKKWEDQTDVEIHEAILDEREACAKVCDDMAFDWQKYVTTPSGTITACAAAIRARGNS